MKIAIIKDGEEVTTYEINKEGLTITGSATWLVLDYSKAADLRDFLNRYLPTGGPE